MEEKITLEKNQYLLMRGTTWSLSAYCSVQYVEYAWILKQGLGSVKQTLSYHNGSKSMERIIWHRNRLDLHITVCVRYSENKSVLEAFTRGGGGWGLPKTCASQTEQTYSSYVWARGQLSESVSPVFAGWLRASKGMTWGVSRLGLSSCNFSTQQKKYY